MLDNKFHWGSRIPGRVQSLRRPDELRGISARPAGRFKKPTASCSSGSFWSAWNMHVLKATSGIRSAWHNGNGLAAQDLSASCVSMQRFLGPSVMIPTV